MHVHCLVLKNNLNYMIFFLWGRYPTSNTSGTLGEPSIQNCAIFVIKNQLVKSHISNLVDEKYVSTCEYNKIISGFWSFLQEMLFWVWISLKFFFFFRCLISFIKIALLLQIWMNLIELCVLICICQITRKLKFLLRMSVTTLLHSHDDIACSKWPLAVLVQV